MMRTYRNYIVGNAKVFDADYGSFNFVFISAPVYVPGILFL